MIFNKSIQIVAQSLFSQASNRRKIRTSCRDLNIFSDYIRSIKFYLNRRMSPPWNHCVQIGDPVLRRTATELPTDGLQENVKELQPLLKQMEKVLNDYRLVGIAAPQIGVPLRIFLMRFKDELKENFSTEVVRAREMQTLPLTTVINPVIKVKNYEKKVFPEGCASICGYTGDVARYYEISLSGYNEKGTHFELPLKGWNARIAQHEMDHLNGQLYTDIMDRKTFTCSSWEAVNFHNGQLDIPFYPRK